MKFKLASILLLAAGMLACERQLPAADAAAKAPAAPAAAAPREIKLQVNVKDAPTFDMTTLTAKPGEEIKLTLTNMGTQPKATMGHNWVLLASGADAMTFSMTAAGAAATDYIPDAMKASVIAHTKILGPGESDSVTFKAPTAPGEYTYLCSFSAHFLLGYKGTLVVK